MNEFFAADPAICGHASELKLLLGAFGPYAGRYLADYPKGWSSLVEGQFDDLGEIEIAKIRTLLRRARESSALVGRANLPWNSEQEWMANAMPLLGVDPIVFDGLIARETIPPAIYQFDDLNLPPTADERIAGTAREYVRVSKILLLLSPEIVVVDPFLDPLKRAYQTVLRELFALAARGKCQKLVLWARASEVFRRGSSAEICSDLHAKLREFALLAKFKRGCRIEMVLVDDEDRKAKMHGRYILSIIGGVRLDQGLSQLPEGRQNDVGPVGKATHNDLLDVYFDGKHDMGVRERLTVNV